MAKARSNNLFNEFADIKALEAQQKKVLDIFSKVENGIERLNKMGFKINSSKNTRETTDSTKQYDAAFKELEKTQKQYIANEAKLQVMRSEDYKKVQEQKIAISQLRKEQELHLKIQQAEKGSLEQMKLEFEAATLTIKKFNKAKRESAEGKQFIDDTRKLSDAINDLQKKAGNFSGNVGRYAESLADGFDLVRREIARLNTEASKLEQSGDKSGAEQVRRNIEGLDRVIKVSFDSNKSYAQSVKAIEKEYQNLAAGGKQSEEFLKNFKKFAAEAKDSAADLKEEIKALSSDTRSFDLVSGAINTVASGFQVAVGVEALFGSESEDVQKTLVKLTAVQNIANGAREIATELTKRGTLANKAYIFVQKLMNTVMTEGIATAKGFKAALGLLGIAVTVIGAVAIALNVFSSKTSDAAKKQKDLNEAMREGGNAYAQALEQVNSLTTNIDLAKKGFISGKDVVKQFNETIGKTTGEVRSLEEAEKSLQKNADAFIKFTFAKAVATASLAQAAQLAVDQQLKLLEGPDKTNIRLFGSDIINKGLADAFNAEQKLSAKRVENLLNFAANQQKIAAELSKQFKFDFFQDGTSDDKSNAGNNTERRKKAELELKKLEIESAAAIQKQIVDIETFNYGERITALQKYIALKNTIIDLDADYELSKAGLTETEKNLILAKAIDDKRKLAEEAGKGLLKVVEKVDEALDEIDFSSINEVSDLISDKFSADMEKNLSQAVQVIDDNNSKLKDAKQRLKETLQQSIESSVFSIFDAEKLKVDALIESIDRLKDAEIARIQGSTEAQEKKDARIKLIEEKAQRDKEALERRQRRIDVQRAIFERAFKGSQITFEGIKTVGAIKLELAKATAEAATNPFLLPALPLIASQIPIAIGTAAASLVSLLTAPLPKFWTGTDWAPEGLAHVAERGREFGIDKYNNVVLYEKPQIAHLTEGTRILNNKVTEDIIASSSTQYKPKTAVAATILNNDEVVNQLKQLNNKKGSVNIYNSPGIETTAWFDKHLRG